MQDPMLLIVMDNYREKIKSLFKQLKSSQKLQLTNEKSSHSEQSRPQSPGGISADSADTQSQGSSGAGSMDGGGLGHRQKDKKLKKRIEQLEIELRDEKRKGRMAMKEKSDLKIELGDRDKKLKSTQNAFDFQNSQIAAMELKVMGAEEEVRKSEQMVQFLRDDCSTLKKRLEKADFMNASRKQFLDQSSLTRASMISTTIKETYSSDARLQSHLDELTKQVEELDKVRAQQSVVFSIYFTKSNSIFHCHKNIPSSPSSIIGTGG